MSAIKFVVMTALLAAPTLAQVSTVPAYITSSKHSSHPSSLTSAALQSILARQLYGSSSQTSSTRRANPTSSPSRYGSSVTGSPSIVAIPLYVRNQAGASKNPSSSLYEVLGNSDKKASASNKYATYQSKKSSLVEAAPHRSESSSSRYEKPVYSSYPKYDQPKASPSSYEPVRSYELKNSEPGYGDASSVSLLSTGYGQQQGSISIAYPPSSYKQSHSTSRPQLKAVEYDDNQKSAFSDFAAALENFDLKSLTPQDIQDLPPVNPPLSRLPSSPKKQNQPEMRAPADDSYGSSSSYTRSQGYDTPKYDSPKQSYASPVSSYDDSRSSYGGQAPSQSYAAPAAPESYSSYSNPASNQQEQAYRSPADNYRASAAAERQPTDSYRASGSDAYGSQASYVPASSNFEAAQYAQPQEVYASRPSSPASYGPSSGEYYAQASSGVRANPDDPNCPYKDQMAPAEYLPESSSTYTSKLSPSQSLKEESLASSQGFDSDELDPSKLDLKIVHLPVSVLKRLVGNGELALPSFNKKK